jgi:voltage-gated potassium channel
MVGRLIVLLIVINLVSMTLDSVPELQTQYGALFTAIELLSLVVFTIEYALRVWVAAEHAPAGTRVSARRDGSSSRARSV